MIHSYPQASRSSYSFPKGPFTALTRRWMCAVHCGAFPVARVLLGRGGGCGGRNPQWLWTLSTRREEEEEEDVVASCLGERLQGAGVRDTGSDPVTEAPAFVHSYPLAWDFLTEPNFFFLWGVLPPHMLCAASMWERGSCCLWTCFFVWSDSCSFFLAFFFFFILLSCLYFCYLVLWVIYIFLIKIVFC